MNPVVEWLESRDGQRWLAAQSLDADYDWNPEGDPRPDLRPFRGPVDPAYDPCGPAR